MGHRRPVVLLLHYRPMYGNPESGIWETFLLVESGTQQCFAVKSEIQDKKYGIPLTIAIRNPSSTDRKSGIWIRNPGSTT